jgi:uncharacterized protein
MIQQEQFKADIEKGYSFNYGSITLGCAMLDGQAVDGLQIKAPLKTFNRHGLIAGATGTGKTKTLQALAERLSEKGVSCLMMDIKGDLSGIAMPGNAGEKILARHAHIGDNWKANQYPVELLSISDEPGVRLRATVSEYGPVLFSRILELNDTQSGVVSLAFKYADDNGLPLLDLKDFKKLLQYLTNEGKSAIEKEYGRISTSSTSTILRKIIEIEEQGANRFFGEPSFDVEDLMQIDERGFGQLNVLRLSDMQTRPKMFSTFMMSLLAEIYQKFEEEGDPEQPKLVLFIDEAHLMFKEASKTLLTQLETIIKLIRSKGVGIFFVTQNPDDIPAPILSQLGMKIQHALRAFTANDRKAIRTAAQNYPLTAYYQVEDLITHLGIGEALVTVLNEKGIPTPLAHTMLVAPQSRMDVLTSSEISDLVSRSHLVKKYNVDIDRESAYEILSGKINPPSTATSPQPTARTASVSAPAEKGLLETLAQSSAGKQAIRTLSREITRGLLGAFLGGSKKRR